ncbi:MAG: hypothetical protein KA319_02735 [Ferruginibacter sp.]|nr:hypothetical protein [Ferruginibacter sp.]
MQQFKNFISTPFLLVKIYKQLSLQKKYLQQQIFPWLTTAKSTNDGSLEEADFKKITHYYGLAVPAILGEAFCALHGKQITTQQRLASTCQGGMTGLFDDFFDKQQLSEEQLKQFIENPITITPNTSNEKLFLQFYNTALQNCPSKTVMLKQLYKVYDAQVQSKLQAKPGLTNQQIIDITIKKGGESLLFYRTAFEFELTDAEQQMLFEMGGLMQLANDIFDVYKDYKAGIHTLMTTTKKVNEVRVLFVERLQKAQEMAYAIEFPPKNVHCFLQIISIGIFSRCFVCLNHLQKAEATTNNIFTPSAYSRQQLICDMDKLLPILQSIRHHIKYCK